MALGDHITQRWLGGTRGCGDGDLGRCHRAGTGLGLGQPGRALLPAGLALESCWLLGSGCEVGCRGAAQPSVQGRGSHDAENPFWPCEPEWSQVPSFIPDLLALRNILQQVWAKAA